MTDELDFELDSGDAGAPASHPDFDEQVKSKIKELTSKDAAKRKEAAYWLGESGEPKAITALVQAYKQNKDKQLKEAARYALGMFRALQKAIDGSDKERDHALTLIEGIVTQGRRGRRAPIRTATLAKIEIGLVFMLALLVVLNLLLPVLRQSPVTTATTSTETPQPDTPAPTPDPLVVLAEMRVLLGHIQSDGSKLQIQLGRARTGEALDCAAVFNSPLPYSLPQQTALAFSEVASIVGQVNAARTDLVTAKAVFDRGCQPGVKLTPEEVDPAVETITNMLRSLSLLSSQLDSAEANLKVALTATAEAALRPTVEATSEVSPTPEPSPTLSASLISQHVVALDGLIAQMTGSRGANTLLEQYWNDAQRVGVTDACRPPYPTIPDDYTAIDDATALAVPKLKQAADLVNLGLIQVRQGWTLFSNACTNNTAAAQAAIGLEFTRSANNAFTAATALLDDVRLGR